VLDLDHAEVTCAIQLRRCTFTDVVELSWARVRTVDFEFSTLAGIEAYCTTVQGALSLISCTVEGKTVLYGVHVSGDLDLDHAQLHGVVGNAMSVDGSTQRTRRERRPELDFNFFRWRHLDGLTWSPLRVWEKTAEPRLGGRGLAFHQPPISPPDDHLNTLEFRML
jgi:hypothetical protein